MEAGFWGIPLRDPRAVLYRAGELGWKWAGVRAGVSGWSSSGFVFGFGGVVVSLITTPCLIPLQ